jgi:transcriptional regulator with XRE-family HTH domain
VDPEWARFHTAAELIQYLADQHLVSNGELAERCGVRREQISRWLSGTHQPNLGGLTEALDKLGWRLVLSLERKPADLDDLIANPPPLTELLDLPVRVVLQAVAAASASGLDVVVGGDVAAVLQGVPVPTRHLVVHVRREHRERFLRLATRSGVSVLEAAGAQWQVRCGPVTAEVVVAPVLPASRMVTDHQDLRIPVVDLEQLLDDPRAISPSVRAAAGRLIDRAG